jgi:Golgi phosphoprotein 3 GPP34
MVSLAEDLYLLADDPATGRPLIDVAHLDLGLGGAQLLDLALRQRIALADEQVIITREGPTGETLLDHALTAVAKPDRAHGPDHWVRHLGRGAHRAVQDRLVDIGILQCDDHRLLHVIPVHRTHETDGRLHHELIGHLRDAVVLGHSASSETSALSLLVLAVGLDRHLFPRSDRQAIRSRLREIAAGCADGAWVGAAVAGAVAAVDAALGIVPGSVTFL